MMLHLPQVLAGDEVAHLRALLADAAWADGRITAGHQGALVKFNRQLPQECPQAVEAARLVLMALARCEAFNAAVLPLRILPPLFNRYGVGEGFGDHIDNAVRRAPGGQVIRTDVSCTLFLSGPHEYDGGELVVEDTFGDHRARLPAGDLLVYPAGSIHRVEPVTRGERLASFFWVQSLVRSDHRRTLLHDLDRALGLLRRRGLAGEPEMVVLTGTYHNLLKLWAES